MWSWSISISAFLVAFVSPLIGAVADGYGLRKKIMMYSTWLCICATLLLFFPTSNAFLAIFIFTIANVSFEIGSVFYNSYLADWTHTNKVGKISAFAWALGYFGGLLALILALVFFVNPDVAPFGLDKQSGEHIRATNILVGIWFFVFSLPFFIIVKEGEPVRSSPKKMIVEAYKKLYSTFKDIGKYQMAKKFLVARLVYNDALITVFSLGGIYASVTIGFSFKEILILGIVLNVMAGLGAFLLGLKDDVWGSKFIIKKSISFLLLASFFAALAPDLPGLCQLAFGGDAVPDFYNSKNIFWLSAIMIGFFAGPIQSSSRSLMTRITPADKKNEFFGFYAFCGKATAFVGPVLFASVSEYFNTQQAGILIVFFMFLLGYFLIKRIVS
jgi:UMF1 family MFS transporter